MHNTQHLRERGRAGGQQKPQRVLQRLHALAQWSLGHVSLHSA